MLKMHEINCDSFEDNTAERAPCIFQQQYTNLNFENEIQKYLTVYFLFSFLFIERRRSQLFIFILFPFNCQTPSQWYT